MAPTVTTIIFPRAEFAMFYQHLCHLLRRRLVFSVLGDEVEQTEFGPIHTVTGYGIGLSVEDGDTDGLVRAVADVITRRGGAFRLEDGDAKGVNLFTQAQSIQFIARTKKLKEEGAPAEEGHRRYREAVKQIRANPTLKDAFVEGDTNKTLARMIYPLAQQLGHVPDGKSVLKLVNESGLTGVLVCSDWPDAVAEVLKGCEATYKAPRRPFPFGLYLDALKSSVRPERLRVPVQGKDRQALHLTFEDVDNAAICYTVKITGKDRKRRVGQCKRSDVIRWFTETKTFTGRGCNKQKANALHELLIEIRWIDIHKSTIRFNGFGGQKPISIRYKLGSAHPEYKGEPEGWDLVD